MWPKAIQVALLASICLAIPCVTRNTPVWFTSSRARTSFQKRGITGGDSIQDSWGLSGQGYRKGGLRSLLHTKYQDISEHLTRSHLEISERFSKSRQEIREHLARSRQDIREHFPRSHEEMSGHLAKSGLNLNERHMFHDADLQKHPWLRREYGDQWHQKDLPEGVMLSYGDLVNQANTKPDTLILGPENEGKWGLIRASFKPGQITDRTQKQLRDWFGKNMSLKKASVFVVLDIIEWNLQRFNSDPVHIWWTSSQIKLWMERSANWKLMVEIGDILDFQTRTQSHTFSAERLPELRRNLKNVMYGFQGPHKPTNGQWGISQSILALKSIMGAKVYDNRINQILRLRKVATNVDRLLDTLHTSKLKLHWFFYGMDPVEAEKIARGLQLGAKSLSNKRMNLMEEEKECIRQFQTILESQFEKEQGYTDRSFMEDWYASVLGEHEYQRRVQEVRRLYRSIIWSDLWSFEKASWAVLGKLQFHKDFWNDWMSSAAVALKIKASPKS